MAGAKGKNATEATNRRGYWQEQIAKALRRYEPFHTAGNQVIDRYRQERSNATGDFWKDRYNILYSSTETTKPSLYAQTPKVEATKRHRDRSNDTVTAATIIMEASTQYCMEEIDFDDVLTNVVEDYVLPGLGTAWVRYEPEIEENGGNAYVASETVQVDYVSWKDFITGPARFWAELPWGARRVFLTKPKAAKRFGADKANRLQYTFNQGESGKKSIEDGAQAIVWEIWDKENRKVIWYSDDFPDDVLDEKPDPLKLKGFWPFPRPLRAISNTRTMVPKAFYSQYKAQATELDNLTERIRYLSDAIKVRGVYDGSTEALQDLLNGPGNKLVKVDNWAQFAGQGGVNGAIQFVPIKDIAAVLMELLKAREVVKNEIYEITGFSDIQRGVSKASETLGAQQIKDNWASARLRSMQKEVQRFCRDLIRIMSEVIAENFSDETLAMYAGFEPPPITPEEQQAAAQYTAATMQGQQMPPPPPTAHETAIRAFKEAVTLLRQEKRRCALIGIETDSTILPDEQKERADRLEFLGQIGAFLQQAGPMALQYPDMRGLMGSLMMFSVRTFRASRTIEKEFEEFTRKLAEQPPMSADGKTGEGDGGAAQAQAKVEEAKLKQQTEQAKMAQEDGVKRYEIDAKMALERDKLAAEERYRMAELDIRRREVAVKEAELGIRQMEAEVAAETAANDAALKENEQAHRQDMDEANNDRADAQFVAGQQNEERRMSAEEAKNAKDDKNGS